MVEVALSPLGERVARDGAVVSRRGPDEGVRSSYPLRRFIQRDFVNNVLAIDIGGTHFRVALFDQLGRQLEI